VAGSAKPVGPNGKHRGTILTAGGGKVNMEGWASAEQEITAEVEGGVASIAVGDKVVMTPEGGFGMPGRIIEVDEGASSVTMRWGK
jgi:hypothetical protein